MRWPTLKKSVERFFAPSLAGRVELRYTRYRGAHDQAGRGYITVDREEVWNMAYYTHVLEHNKRIRSRCDNPCYAPRSVQIQVDKELEEEGILSESDFLRSLYEYRNTSIEQSLASSSPLTRSLVMLDARFGKRRLATFDVSNENEMVRYFHALRCEAESISL